MELKNVVEGRHNTEEFRYLNGKLQVFGRQWDKEDIRTLVEIANLLEMQGYKLKVPTGKRTQKQYDFFSGRMYSKDIKTYDEEDSNGGNLGANETSF